MSFLSLATSWGPWTGRSLRGLARLALGVALLGFSLALLAWLTLHWGILPRLDEWRPRVEQLASERLGVRVQIGRLEAHSARWVPAFTLHDVVLRDALDREALRLPRVSAALSVPSLLALQPRLAQLLIDDARLHIRRDAQGRWQVAGLDMAGSGPEVDSGASLDWLLEQGEFVIRGGQVRWVDEWRQAPPLTLTDVQLVLRNRGRRHAFRLDATPPPAWGERFQVLAQARGPLLDGALWGRRSDWRRWSGSAHVLLPRADVSLLRQHVDLPVDLRQGQAAVRAWLDWDRARPEALTLDARLRDVRLGLVRGQPPLALREAGVRLVAERLSEGGKVALQQLQLVTQEGVTWAPSDLALQWRWARPEVAAAALAVAGEAALPVAPAASAASASASASADPWTLAGGQLDADRLDLATLATLAERLPLGDSLRQLLLTLRPEGTVRGLQAQWQGPLDAPRQWRVKAALRGMAMAAAPSPEPGGIGRPGWRGADLDLEAGDAGGQASLRLDKGQLEFPGVFEQPRVPLQQFSAQLLWRVERPAATGAGAGTGADAPAKVSLELREARFANDDAQGELEATWHTGAGTGFGKGGRLPGVISLHGKLAQGRATSVARYLPMGIPVHTRDWVRHAVQAGEVRDVAFRVEGDLWEFPFVNRAEGEFRIAGQVRGAVLAPVPSAPAERGQPAWTSPWPAFSQVEGELVFERNSMQFQKARGRLWGVELQDVQGRIRELSSQALLEVEGQVHGPAADLLRYVRSTPLSEWTQHQLDGFVASGPVDLRLGLNLPLARLGDSLVQGDLQLGGNDVRLGASLPLMPGARGRVSFTHRGVQAHAVRTQLFGGDVQIDGGSQAEGGLRFVLAGTATADGLRRAPELGPLARWAQRLHGQTAYRLQLGVANGQPEVQLTSTLQGMAIDLPPPMRKPADSSWTARLQSTLQREPGTNGQAGRDTVRVELGPLQVALVRDLTGAEPRVLRSAYGLGTAAPDPVAGGRAVLNLPSLDVDPWRQWLAAAPASATVSIAASAPLPGTTTSTTPTPATAPFDASELGLPATIRLQTPELLAAGRRLTGVTLDLQRVASPTEAGWHAQVVADQTRGSVDYREPRGNQVGGRVRARLSRLVLPQAEADRVAGELESAASSVPALDIEVDNFELRGRSMGRLSVQATHRAQPGGDGRRSEWRLNDLRLELAGAGELRAHGVWQPAAVAGGARRVALELKLGINDAGQMLERLGFGRVLKGGQGDLSGSLGWDGSPLGMDFATMGGALQLKLAKGQFLKADAGAARLLGVMSLQALPRRLALDFRDLFQEGFLFDEVRGDLVLQSGVLATSNLRMNGLQAAVLLEGSADIVHETQKLHVVVLPELNTASASLAYAAIHPAVGLGALVGQWLLRDPLQRASAREFRITGSWDDPQVQRVERGLLDPVPLQAQAASGAAASASTAGSAAPSGTAPAVPPSR